MQFHIGVGALNCGHQMWVLVSFKLGREISRFENYCFSKLMQLFAQLRGMNVMYLQSNACKLKCWFR